MSRQISGGRKAAYYLGLVLMIIGGICFASVFVTFAMLAGRDSGPEIVIPSVLIRAAGGLALMVIGGGIRSVGARGLAGSGVVLDPERARGELEPYARMAGGMVKDALDEARIKTGTGAPERVVMIKCPSCGKLNDGDARFCKECGKTLQGEPS